MKVNILRKIPWVGGAYFMPIAFDENSLIMESCLKKCPHIYTCIPRSIFGSSKAIQPSSSAKRKSWANRATGSWCLLARSIYILVNETKEDSR